MGRKAVVSLDMIGKITEAAAIASALSVDAFAAGLAYGSKRIRIPLSSVFVIALVCSAVLGGFLWAGAAAGLVIPQSLQRGICFLILFGLGLGKFSEGLIRSAVRKRGWLDGSMRFSLFHLRFVLYVYADPEAADIDHSKTISVPEAASLALALSLDGAAVGFGAALGEVSAPAVLGANLIATLAAVLAGDILGEKAAGRLPFPVSRLAGLVLMLLACLKLAG